ncbi:MAG: hypothetical protein IJM59_00265 [Proteobacteria bacterium]|nr:hypothetical protein [Pseudomonadota bacterium]
MPDTSTVQRLSAILSTIRDTALEIHEQFEKNGSNPLLDFEHLVLQEGRRLSDYDRATILWHLLLFTEPRLESQKKFQNAVSAKLPNAEASIIVRQLTCFPPRAWSFRPSYDRGFGHSLAGPNAHTEISIDACLSGYGDIQTQDHVYAIGWTLTFEDHIFLIAASELSQNQIYEIEAIKPFPKQLNDDDFWEESLFSIIQNVYEAQPQLSFVPKSAPDCTDYSPERRFERLNRIITGTLPSNIIRTEGTLQITVAKGDAQTILNAVDRIVTSVLTNSRDQVFRETLRCRTLQAVGCDNDGNMPHAHISLLTADPVALLLLPDDLPMFREIGSRDSIKMALQYDEKNGTHDATDAFSVFQRERRWLAAFPCFDFSIEEHAARFGIPVSSIQTLFDPALFSARLPIVPQGDVLRQLQNKYGFYQPDAPLPTFRDVIDAISSRAFIRSGNMTQIVQWLISCCDRWRYCLCDIEPEHVQKTFSRSNQKLLQKGLKSLSDMFKKV